MRMLGVVLIVLGIVALVYQGFTYKKREKVLDIGPIEATTTEKKTVPIHPLVGGAALVAGVLLVLSNRRSPGPA